MKTVLYISSQTVAGVVGNMPGIFILQSMGHRVWPIPTSLNSNHGGHPHALRETVDEGLIDGLVANIESNGWLAECDAVFTGHFSSTKQIVVARKWIEQLKTRKPELIYCCDPILGDEAPPGFDPKSGGIYVAREIAEGIRDTLLPLADIISPNRFELEYLSGMACTSPEDAAKAATSLGPKTVLATSIPSEGNLATLLCSGSGLAIETTPLLRDVPKGTGDVLVALYLGHSLAGLDGEKALKLAVQTLYEICLSSVKAGTDELMLIENRNLLQRRPKSVQ